MIKFFAKGSIIILLLSLMISSCSDDKLNVGIEILPDSEILLATADTLAVSCFTHKGIAGYAQGSSSNLSQYPIGVVYDSEFGTTEANVALQLSYTTDYYQPDTANFPDEVKTLKLYLKTGELGVFGDNEQYDIDVFLLNGNHNYAGNTNQAVASDLYDPTDSKTTSTTHNIGIYNHTVLDSSIYTVVELDKELAAELMDTIYTNGLIYDIMYGILLKASSKDGTIGCIQNFIPASSKLVLEYVRPNIGIDNSDSVLYSSFEATYFHCNYRHQHINATIEDVLRDTTKESSNFYVQGLGGTRGIIKLNALADFKNTHQDSVGINLAELVVPISQESLSDTVYFGLPNRLKVSGLLYNGDEIILPDEYFPDGYINGVIDTENWLYRFNVTEYVSQYLLNDLDYLLFNMNTSIDTKGDLLYSDYYRPSRVVLNSGLESDDKENAFLRIIYTKKK